MLAGGDAAAQSYAYNPPPAIFSVTAQVGPASGGTTVTIDGSGFLTGIRVTFDGIAATNVVLSGSTSLTAKTPAHAAGTVTVTVRNLDGQTSSLAGAFTYLPGPTVTSISPVSATAAGGVVVTISGQNFATGATVKLGGTAATSVVVQSSTIITATAPAHAAGQVDVLVTNPDAQKDTLVKGFTYTAAPVISSIAPAGGLTVGGTTVTITGTGFMTPVTVTFGSSAATVVSATTTQIVVTTPARAEGSVTVSVTNLDGQEAAKPDGYLYDDEPHLTSVSPATSPTTGGVAITLTGTGFLPGSTVTLGGTAATSVTVVNSGSITAKTPAHAAGAVDVVVTNPDGKTAALVDGVEYIAPPGRFTASPATGFTTGGLTVTLSGSDFRSGATVKVRGTPATEVVVLGATAITFRTPVMTAGAATIEVTNPDGQKVVVENAFTYMPAPAPTLLGVAPATGPIAGGTTIIISGTGLAPGAIVTVGGVSASGIVVLSATSITAVTPPGAEGTANVVITNVDGQTVMLTNGFEYVGASQASRDDDIEAGNKGITLQVRRSGTDNIVNFQLGTLSGTAAGAQLWSSNSPFKWVADLPADSDAFKSGAYTDADAPANTKYLVTVYYGKTASEGYAVNHQSSEIPGFAALETKAEAPTESTTSSLPWIIVGILAVGLLVALAVVFMIRRRNLENAQPVTGNWAAGNQAAATPPVERSIRCPDCQTHFTAQGSLPLMIHCVSCGKRGTLVA